METTTLEITVTVDRDSEKMATLLSQYLTGEDSPIREDYGVGAWGGYDGPFLTSVTVSHRGRTLARSDWTMEG